MLNGLNSLGPHPSLVDWRCLPLGSLRGIWELLILESELLGVTFSKLESSVTLFEVEVICLACLIFGTCLHCMKCWVHVFLMVLASLFSTMS